MGQVDRRVEFNERLCQFLDTRNVYFMPGADIHMKYPCIRYELAGFNQTYANNRNYNNREHYTLTLITDDPDTELREKLMRFLMTYPYKYDRAYVVDNLYHDVFSVYL